MQVAAAGVDAGGATRRGRTYVALAALAWSSAGVLQRGLSVDVATQVAGRAFFAVLALLAYVIAVERGRPLRGFLAIGRDGLAIAGLMAVSSGSFIVALNHTSVANVLVLQAISPLIAAALGALVLHERISRRTLVAMGLALLGVGVMVGSPGHADALGEGLALLMSLSFAAAIVLIRRSRSVSMAPATCLSQALLLVCFAPFAQPGQVGGHDLVLLFLLGFGQIGLALIFLMIGARLIPAGEVALISLLEVVLGPIWVWLAWSERPSTATLVGGAIVLLGVLVQIRPTADAPEEAALEYPL
jgi:drug/metabolite transporter (DMT)-like permease